MGDSDDDASPPKARRPPPPPPPPRPHGAARQHQHQQQHPGDTPSSKLSNQDFRKMVLETPRRGSGGGGGLGGNSERRDSNQKQRKKEHDSDALPGGKPTKKPWGKGKVDAVEAEGEAEDAGGLYRDRAKERREDVNPDYKDIDAVAERISVLNAVAPPGSTDITTGHAHKLAIEQSKFLGGDLEHTHLVKGLDFALLQKVKGEIDRRVAAEKDGVQPGAEGAEAEEGKKGKGKQQRKLPEASFRTTVGQSVYELLLRPPQSKASEFFLPGRTSFVFDMDDEFSQEIPTAVHRSKADCAPPEDLVSISVDAPVLDRIGNIMNYLRLGSSAKGHKKKKKDRGDQVLIPGLVPTQSSQSAKDSSYVSGALGLASDLDLAPSRAAAPRAGTTSTSTSAQAGKAGAATAPHGEEQEEDIFADAGKDYVATGAKEGGGGGGSNAFRNSEEDIFAEASGVREPVAHSVEGGPSLPPLPPDTAPPLPPSEPPPEYFQGPAPPPSDVAWTEYPPPPPEDQSHLYAYSTDSLYAQGYGPGVQGNEAAGWYPEGGGGYGGADWVQQPGGHAGLGAGQGVDQGYIGVGGGSDPLIAQGVNDAAFLTQAEKERGLGSVFKRFDEAEDSARRRAAADTEKDPAYISSSYAECYPDYNKGFAGEVVESDEEADTDKMDIGAKTKKGMHRWDFDNEEDWADYNAKKEIMPSEAFQYGIKAVDGRKSKKALKDKDQKINNELHQINKIIDRRRKDRGGDNEDFSDEVFAGKKVRV